MATKTKLGGFDDDGEWLRRFWSLAAPRGLGATFNAANLLGDQMQAIRALQEGFAAARFVSKFDTPKMFTELAVQRRLAIADAWKPLVTMNFDNVLREFVETASRAVAVRADELDEDELAQFYDTLADVSDRLERGRDAAEADGSHKPGSEPLTRYEKLNLLFTMATMLIMLYVGVVGSDRGATTTVGTQLNVERLQISIEEVHPNSDDELADLDELEERVSRVIAEVVARLPEDALDSLSEAALSELESLEGDGGQVEAEPADPEEASEEE